MPAVVEWKGMRCIIRYLNILFHPSNVIPEENHMSSTTTYFKAQPFCVEQGVASGFYWTASNNMYLTGASYRKSPLALKMWRNYHVPEVTTSLGFWLSVWSEIWALSLAGICLTLISSCWFFCFFPHVIEEHFAPCIFFLGRYLHTVIS